MTIWQKHKPQIYSCSRHNSRTHVILGMMQHRLGNIILFARDISVTFRTTRKIRFSNYIIAQRPGVSASFCDCMWTWTFVRTTAFFNIYCKLGSILWDKLLSQKPKRLGIHMGILDKSSHTQLSGDFFTWILQGLALVLTAIRQVSIRAQYWYKGKFGSEQSK